MTAEQDRAAISDPMERMIADALDAGGYAYTTDAGGDNPSGLDFCLASGVEIEVKQFHSDRIAAQMSRAPNVIAVQGKGAVQFMAELLRGQQERAAIVAWLREEAEQCRPYLKGGEPLASAWQRALFYEQAAGLIKRGEHQGKA